MKADLPDVTLLETKDIDLFIRVMREIELGDRFLLSMLHWCGIGKRHIPLELWRVFLLRGSGEIVGVTGIYRQPGMAKRVGWIGWFGIRPRFRRRGYGSNAVSETIRVAREEGCDALYVYTGSENHQAVQFYKSIGFHVLGIAADCAPGQTMESTDVVLEYLIADI